MVWLENQLKTPGTQHIILTHIYAGAQIKSATQDIKEFWFTNYTDWYFNLIKANKDQLLLEIGGHDHFEDIRVFDDIDPSGISNTLYRNLLIMTGISARNG